VPVTYKKENPIWKDLEKLHHAYLVEGEREKLLEEIRGFLESTLSIRLVGNADYREETFDSFGIDNARSLIEWAILRPSFGERKFFVLACNTMTSEAQNALLKLFEEPTGGTHFFLIVPNASIFLPTFRSRLYHAVVSLDKTGSSEKAELFFTLTPSERLREVKEIVDAIADEKMNRQDAVAFLSSLESVAARQLKKGDKKFGDFTEDLIRAKRDLYSRSPSVKLLLEHIALIAPTVQSGKHQIRISKSETSSNV